MEKAELLPLSRRLQGRLQAYKLPVEDFRAVFAPFLLIEPAPGPAQGHFAVQAAVVVQNFQGAEPVFGKESFHLGRGGPPVVVVSFQQDLPPAGQSVQKGKVLPCLLQAHAPGQISAQDHRVLRADLGKALPELLHITGPPPAENVHGLVRPQGQMGISDGV